MKVFLADILPQIGRFSQKLNNLTLLTNQHWVLINTVNEKRIVYIFRKNNELLLSADGRVEKAKWEFVGNQSLLIDRKTESNLLKLSFFDESVLALKYDNNENYMILINEEKTNQILKSIDSVSSYLEKRYLIDNGNKNKVHDSKESNLRNALDKNDKMVVEDLESEEENSNGIQIFIVCVLTLLIILLFGYFIKSF